MLNPGGWQAPLAANRTGAMATTSPNGLPSGPTPPNRTDPLAGEFHRALSSGTVQNPESTRRQRRYVAFPLLVAKA
jgi:hypothetical protein